MLACVNAAPQFATESTRTLEFAMGVAKIKNRPTAVLNPHVGSCVKGRLMGIITDASLCWPGRKS
jgi:hypothetical protein